MEFVGKLHFGGAFIIPILSKRISFLDLNNRRISLNRSLNSKCIQNLLEYCFYSKNESRNYNDKEKSLEIVRKS